MSQTPLSAAPPPGKRSKGISLAVGPARPGGRQRAGERWTTARYRVYQFCRSVFVRGLDAADREVLAAALPPGGRALFATMSRNDQRHSLTVYRALRARGCQDAELLAAALLHDSGKGSGRVRLWVRPPFVLLRALAPGLLRWLAQRPSPFFRRPFYYAWHHAEIGAALAEAAGLSPRVALLIRTHHQADGPAAELHAVDEGV